MRLKKIKLSGFKSFVDPTVIDFPQNLVGIVGPNGCGKSNVIDAVRWVMGESSAKQLRGESIADVIFNGSSSRKPVGQAMVELIFDNEGGMLGGEYARYAEISLKRQVAREGGSLYYLNGTKCRRRDIIDIFLGTGLGSRSYAIIEQGMISRLIEAKPDELRVYLEEAAGVSKYKERRKETESRIEQTLNNLSRLNDIRTELGQQLLKLNSQAKAAEKYQGYQQEKNECAARLYAFRFKKTSEELGAVEKALGKVESEGIQTETAMIALSQSIEAQKTAYQEAHQVFNHIQGEYYEVSAEISKQQQVLELAQKNQKEWSLELQTALAHWEEVKENYEREQKGRSEVECEIKTLVPTYEQAGARLLEATHTLNEVERLLEIWQEKWDGFNQDASKIREQAELTRSKLAWKEEDLQKNKRRKEELTQEYQGLNSEVYAALCLQLSLEHQSVVEKETRKVEEKRATAKLLDAVQNELKTVELALNHEQTEAREMKGQLASLITLQEIALGIGIKKTDPNQMVLNAPRVAEMVAVEKGYEKMVELGLGVMLGAYCVEHITLDETTSSVFDEPIAMVELCDSDLTAEDREQNQHSKVCLPALVQKIKAPKSILELLTGIYVADSVHEALKERDHLKKFESILTHEGFWLGKRWVRRLSEDKEKTGILAREEEIRALKKKLWDKTLSIEALQKQLELLESKKKELEADKGRREQEWEELQKQVSELHIKKGGAETNLKALESQKNSLEESLSQLDTDGAHLEETVKQEKKALESLCQQMVALAETRSALVSEKDLHHQKLVAAKETLKAAEGRRHELELLKQSLAARQLYAEENEKRFEKEIEELQTKVRALAQKTETLPANILQYQEKLQLLLLQQKNKEALLVEARKSVEAYEQRLKEYGHDKYKHEQVLNELRQRLEEERLKAQALQLKAEEYKVRIEEGGKTLGIALAALLPECTAETYQQELEKIEQRITRLGPINLMAIEECRELSLRKTHLDTQCSDLEQALNTLREAIRKIDGETRARFQETFEAVNHHLRILFPKIFGGGEAYLEMTGTEVLDAGVAVMARPPGKRNSSIHLLSGGEKALTAIALVFSIFELNPAPFCMLDEVDAALDDANVSRYCKLLKEIAEQIQFIFVTHNKNTMELATQLIGVTMQEAGVSRLVGVDLNEAVAWAEA